MKRGYLLLHKYETLSFPSLHIYFSIWHWVQIIPLCYCPLRYPGKCGKYPHKYVHNKHLDNCFYSNTFWMSFRKLNQLKIKYVYFLCSNKTATKINYKFDILTRKTAFLVTQQTSLYDNHMIINWKCGLFSSKYIFLCVESFFVIFYESTFIDMMV